MLKEEGKSIALTTDGWTSKATESYNATTAHFIDSRWELRSCVLETSLFPENHTAINIKDKVHAAVETFHVPDGKVIGVVHDEAASMMKAGRNMQDEFGWETNACSAHLLQTCIRHAITSNTSIATLLKRARQLVGHFKHSALATTALCLAQTGTTPPLKVIQDCPTRWNSALFMLERLIKLELPIRKVLADQQNRTLLLADHQWALAEKVVAALKDFELATTTFGGETYSTMSLVAPVIHGLLDRIDAQIVLSSPTSSIGQFHRCLASELRKKFSAVANSDPLSLQAMCSALDPRFRDLSFLSATSAKTLRENVTTQLLVANRESEEITRVSAVYYFCLAVA